MIIGIFAYLNHFILKYKFHILTFFLCFFLLSRFYFSPDLGWHLAYGTHFLHTGETILADPFSWTMSGFEWVSSYFLYQIIVAFLFSKFSFWVIALIFGALCALSMIILLPKKMNEISILLAIIGSGIAISHLGVKPHVFDMLFFAILLLFLEKKLYLRKFALIFVLLFFALWANFHLGFIVGIITLAGFVFLDTLQFRSVSKAIYIAGKITTVALIGVLINPHGYRILFDIFLKSGGFAAWTNISEFLPLPLSHFNREIYIISVVIFILLIKKFKKPEDIKWLFLGAFLLILPLLISYFAVFWSVTFVFISLRYSRFSFEPKSMFTKIFLNSVWGLLIFVILFEFIANSISAFNFNNLLTSQFFPVNAIHFMKKQNLTDGVFNDYNWGGYMIWKIPEAKVFIDGRMAGWQDNQTSIFAEYLEIEKGNCEVAKKFEIKTILVNKNNSIPCFDDFNLRYEDSVSKILTAN